MEEAKHIAMSENHAVVACGTLRREMLQLVQTGVLDKSRLFFTAPGLHEWPERLRKQLTRQLEKARHAAEHVIVAYGEKCYFDAETGVDTDGLLAEWGSRTTRVAAKHCVDMLADEVRRNHWARGEKVYWLTPGWLEHWDFIFKDWDAAKANETFPANDKAILLDAVAYYDELSLSDPERILRICDWMKLQLVPQTTSLDRLESLLLESTQRTREPL